MKLSLTIYNSIRRYRENELIIELALNTTTILIERESFHSHDIDFLRYDDSCLTLLYLTCEKGTLKFRDISHGFILKQRQISFKGNLDFLVYYITVDAYFFVSKMLGVRRFKILVAGYLFNNRTSFGNADTVRKIDVDIHGTDSEHLQFSEGEIRGKVTFDQANILLIPNHQTQKQGSALIDAITAFTAKER
jgi:hypothetical protein